ncbi:MAG: peptide chain release factor N(5)-glutamine methyltransferase [Clostridiales bacterium]|nr:peptide chain release factor N(5)-glutamine methyltransferase [Clostridiales bacterium]
MISLKSKTVKDLLREMTALFKENGAEDAALDASLILMRQLGFSRTELYTKDDYCPDENQMRKIDYWAEKHAEGCPVQYLLGKCEFMGLTIKVQDMVLIPRADTETLVETVSEIIKEKSYKTGLDLGTGSGCIAVSLSSLNKGLKMTASDISLRPIFIAEQNAKDHKADINFVLSDLFENIEGKFDFIVSNPPYIPTEVIPTLEKNVKNYEAEKALDGGKDGLDYIRKIIEQAPSYLNPGGLLAFETGYDQREAVDALFKAAGYKNINHKNDLGGRHRVSWGFV